MQKTCKYLLILMTIMLAACTKSDGFDLADVIHERPDKHALIFDYVGIMQDVEESTTRYLNSIRDRYQIEILFAALPSLNQQYTVSQAAATIFSNWKIGKTYQSRGILLLLVDDSKEVKLEVGFELEDVFTDMFTGHIENHQLPTHYRANELDIGLIALLEELEARAQLKFSGDFSDADIVGLDSAYLSQGGGARHALKHDQEQVAFSGNVNRSYPAGRTPEEAWQTMRQRWKDKARDPYLEVFTPLTRLAYRAFRNLPDSHFDKAYRTYAQKSYDIRMDGDYAVVYFGRKEGWDNAPFLLCRTSEGWQFDLVHQRRFIRMGQAPHWGVEFSEHPHMDLLMDSFQFRGQDIPLLGEDLYFIERDAELAKQILEYEATYQADPNNFETALALGRLYTLTAMSRKGIAVLKDAKKLDPEDPRPYKYLAIGHVNAHYQYAAALKELNAFLEREPQDEFGHNFKGFIHYRQKAYAKAAASLEQALALNPDNCYTHFYLAYTYAWLYDRALKLDPRRTRYQKRHKYHAEQTRAYHMDHPLRVETLNNWLTK